MKQHLKAPDPWAAITGAALTISGIFELEKAFGITASELAIFVGSLITIGASLRFILTLRKAPQVAPPPSMTETLTAEDTD